MLDGVFFVDVFDGGVELYGLVIVERDLLVKVVLVKIIFKDYVLLFVYLVLGMFNEG